jgi:hypothetical protein
MATGVRVNAQANVQYQEIESRVAYANWPRAVFGFLGATADEVRAADVTALAGFPRIEVDPWLRGMTGASTELESADTTLTNPAPWASDSVCGETDDAGEVEAEWEASVGLGVCSD